MVIVLVDGYILELVLLLLEDAKKDMQHRMAVNAALDQLIQPNPDL